MIPLLGELEESSKAREIKEFDLGSRRKIKEYVSLSTIVNMMNKLPRDTFIHAEYNLAGHSGYFILREPRIPAKMIEEQFSLNENMCFAGLHEVYTTKTSMDMHYFDIRVHRIGMMPPYSSKAVVSFAAEKDYF